MTAKVNAPSGKGGILSAFLSAPDTVTDNPTIAQSTMDINVLLFISGHSLSGFQFFSRFAAHLSFSFSDTPPYLAQTSDLSSFMSAGLRMMNAP
jgi:hypothetical protein